MARKPSPKAKANQLLEIILDTDADRLARIDRYYQGDHDRPYVPDNASEEYELLTRRCTNNWFRLLVATPVQACYVDNFRPGREGLTDDDVVPEWKHWHNSRLDSRQHAIYQGALTYGHSFTITELRRGKVQTKGLSALRTAALFKDPANDETPTWALTITRHANAEKEIRGEARMWDDVREYAVTYESVENPDKTVVTPLEPHGASSCPVTRFAAAVDLEGRTVGVVEPMIVLQDRINQTIFDLLIAQTYAAIKVRTISGMTPPIETKVVENEEGEKVLIPVLDNQGRPQPKPVRATGARIMYAENPEARFGTLDETPLDGFINAIDMSIRHLSAISQTPPHYLLGQIANLSADALKAAEISLSRKIAQFRSSFGESWERVFRLAAEMEGITEAVDDTEAEVIWRDVDLTSLGQHADGLGKLAEMLGVPRRGLWKRVPNVTANEIREWNKLADEESTQFALVEALSRATTPGAPIRRPAASPRPTPAAPVPDRVP